MTSEHQNIADTINQAHDHFNAGRTDLAVSISEQILSIDPENADALFLEGLVANAAGHHRKASELFRRAIVQQPQNAEFHNNLGLALAKQRDFAAAFAEYSRALELRPDYPKALKNLAPVLIEGGAPEDAVKVLERALELEPGYVDAMIGLGMVHNLLNRPELAAERFQSALRLRPNDPKAQNGLGNALQYLGKFDGAITAYRSAIRLKPDFGSAFLQLTSLDSKENLAALISDLEGLLSKKELDPAQEPELCFALGKAYDSTEDYDRAFTYFARGCSLKRATYIYDVANFEDLTDRIIRIFDADFLAKHSKNGCPSDVPVFVIGMPRSGTSMVEQILASHSNVFGAGEFNSLSRIARLQDQPSGPEFPETIEALDNAELTSLGEAYSNILLEYGAGTAYVIDKTPMNFLYTGFVGLILPNAKIIHCRRNPIDTCLSCHNLLFGMGQEFSYDLKELGRFYVAYQRLMDHFHAVLPDRILDVRYEDVIAYQESETRRMLEFLSLPWEDACLSFHKTNRSVQTASAGQVKKPLYKTSIARWKRYEKHLAPLVEALGPLAEVR